MKDTLDKLNMIYALFFAEATKAAGGNKAAGVRARKRSLEIGQMLLTFRKESVK